MLGAIIGDIVGSAYEFNPTNDYNFEMFAEGSSFTDDTICTIAIADALLKGRDYGESLHDWCRRYMKPKGGFGGRFRKWVESDNPQPYGSYGNGSAMRVSPIGMWFSNDWDKVLEEAKKSAECTHNHPEGIHGAQCIADAVHFAVVDCDGLLSDKKINDFVIDLCVCKLDDYNYDPDTDYETFRGKFDETCQGTVPPALDIICKSHSFEDAIRRAVSLAADADTLGAIVGSIAEHIWGIPSSIKEKALTYLTDEMRKVVDDFYLALENREDYKPKSKEISKMESMMLWKLGAGHMGKFMSMEDPMPSKEKKATAKSWETKELPLDDVADIAIHFEIPEDKMKVLMQGHIPEAQEDHWFMYCDRSHIRYYRSWTGECAFEAHFHKDKDKYIIDHLFANHALNEFGVNGDIPAKVLFLYLVYSDIDGVNHRCWLEYLNAWEEQYKINVDAAEEAEKKATEDEEAKKKAEQEAELKQQELEEASRQRQAERERKKWMKEVDRRMITDFATPYMTCVVAGTQFIEDQRIFYKFEVNDMLTLQYEENEYDENAVAIYFKDYKIGYVPRKQNKELSKILKTGWDKIFIAYVSDWQGHGEKRKITVEILMKPCFEHMPVDYDDSVEWWSKKMVEILDMQPRHSVFEPWELWSKTYWVFGKGHCHCFDRPMEWVDKAVNLCIESIKDRYNCTRLEDGNHIRFDRFKDDEYSQNDPFEFDRSAFVSYKNAEEAQLYFSTGGSTGTLVGRMTPEKIDKLEEGEIFVFGSNAMGHHGGGAAYAAMKKFGAIYGQGDGLQGQSYAISTMEGLVNTAGNINRFIDFASGHQELRFLVTPIGCGIAGYNPLQIAPLFRKALTLPNVYLPRIFWEYFWMVEGVGPDFFKPSEDWEKWNK